MKHAIHCTAFKPLRKGTLIGFADIVIRELRLKIRDVTLHEKSGSRWASPPGRPWIQDGAAVTDAESKVQYSPVLEFETRETRDAFSAAVWRAVQDFGGVSAASNDIFDIENDTLDTMLARRDNILHRHGDEP